MRATGEQPLRGFAFVLTVLAVALPVAYGAVLAMLWFRQERLLFQPEVLAPDTVLSRAPDVHEAFVEVPGARLSVQPMMMATGVCWMRSRRLCEIMASTLRTFWA